MLRPILTTLVVLFVIGPASASELPHVFNGRDLSGWVVPENNVWWSARSGILRLESDPEQTGSTLWTRKEYGNFIMEFDFRLGAPTDDTGIYLRHQREQIQIGMSGSLRRDMTGSPYIGGKGYPVEARGVKELLRPADWNHMTIVVIGKSYSVWLNGEHVVNYRSDSAPEKGPIGIQLHGNREMISEYKNITLAELKSSAAR